MHPVLESDDNSSIFIESQNFPRMSSTQSATDRVVASLILPGILLMACITNPSMADFDQHLQRESGMLSLHEYQRQNFYVASLYRSQGYSLRRGQEERLVLGVFGNFIPLKEQSTW